MVVDVVVVVVVSANVDLDGDGDGDGDVAGDGLPGRRFQVRPIGHVAVAVAVNVAVNDHVNDHDNDNDHVNVMTSASCCQLTDRTRPRLRGP